MQYSYDLFVRELGAKLKQMRTDRGWTLRDMVIKHRLHLTQWKRVESGKGVSTPTLLQICEVFDVSLSQLAGELGQVDGGGEPATKLLRSTAEIDLPPAKRVKGTKKAATHRGS